MKYLFGTSPADVQNKLGALRQVRSQSRVSGESLGFFPRTNSVPSCG